MIGMIERGEWLGLNQNAPVYAQMDTVHVCKYVCVYVQVSLPYPLILETCKMSSQRGLWSVDAGGGGFTALTKPWSVRLYLMPQIGWNVFCCFICAEGLRLRGGGGGGQLRGVLFTSNR